MARTIERPVASGGVLVAEPPVISPEEPEPLAPPTPTLRGKPRGRWTVGRVARIGRWASAGLAAAGIARENRSLGPLVGEQVSWWMELPEARIRELAVLPEIHQIGETRVSTVSPALQARAKAAGYKLIYQGDPDDTTGRTVVAGKRQFAEGLDDLGFGRLGGQIRGFFKAWVPDPEDPTQIKSIYALLINPLTGKEYLTHINLVEFDPTRNEAKPTWLRIDNLSYGPEYITEKSRIAGFGLTSEKLPDPDDPPERRWIAPKDIPNQTFYHLLRRENHSLSDLVQPGDYVYLVMYATDVPGDFRKDRNGVGEVGSFVSRRFGGFKQWQSEAPK